ncbi:MAG: M20/M25/M40 family metallo-hydrolase [Gaiellales bacterium]|nr:MAG: M20/M25/M40 family metallo-hydrolase [Gaiellales bacterium]
MSEAGSESGERLVGLFLELASLPSPTGGERLVADYLKERLGRTGLMVVEGPPVGEGSQAAGNLYCHIPPSAEGTPILFSAHMDTVVSEPGAMPEPLVEGGIIKSGSRAVLGADDKAAIAAMVLAVERVLEEGRTHAGIELLFTVCEESGLRGAKASSMESIAAECGFCMDCTGKVGGIVVRSPSQKTIRARFSGRAAHAGVEPEKGRSAIRAAAAAIAAMELGRLDDDTTANIGTIKGGDAINVVPASCEIEGEARSHDPDRLEEVVGAMMGAINLAAAQEGVDVETVVVDEFSGFDFRSGGQPLELAARAVKRLGLEPSYISTGGGSDVNVLNLKGLKCVNLAIGMEKLHSPDEFIAVESLVQAHRLLMEIITEAAG